MKFQNLVYGAIFSLLSLSANAIPEAGVSIEDALTESQAYLSAVEILKPTNQQIEQADSRSLSDAQMGKCLSMAISRSQIFFVVTFATAEGNKKILFGTAGDLKQFQNCGTLN